MLSFLTKKSKKLHISIDQDGSIETHNMIALYRRWENRDADWTGTRLVAKIVDLHQQKNPEIQAILADNVGYFKDKLMLTQERLLGWVEIACLCHSKQVVYFLLPHVDITESNNLIGYALSTKDEKFAIELTKLAIAKGLKMLPIGMHLYDFGNSASKLENMLNENSQQVDLTLSKLGL